MVMKSIRVVELTVGVFIIAGVLAFFVLAMKVSGLTSYVNEPSFIVAADFDNIGDLKVRSPVTIAGVRIGNVARIDLNKDTFKARVMIRIRGDQSAIPKDSSASILTEGLLGSNYISITPGFSEKEFLAEGSVIEETNPALVLENLIGQLLFSLTNKDEKKTSQ